MTNVLIYYTFAPTIVTISNLAMYRQLHTTMKLIEKLDAIIAHPRKSGVTSNRVVQSLKELRYSGKTCTGISERRRADSWTTAVIEALATHKIPYHSGNNAPRGGMNGEFVQLTSPAMLKVINAEIAERKRIADLEEQKRIERYNNMLKIAQNIKDGLYDDYLRENKERILQPRLNKSTKKTFWHRIATSIGTYNCADVRNAIYSRINIINQTQ